MSLDPELKVRSAWPPGGDCQTPETERDTRSGWMALDSERIWRYRLTRGDIMKNVRAVISLHEDDKRWLDKQATREGVPMTELIRRAVRLLRAHQPTNGRGLDELLDATAGNWQGKDGIAYQRRVRDEW